MSPSHSEAQGRDNVTPMTDAGVRTREKSSQSSAFFWNVWIQVSILARGSVPHPGMPLVPSSEGLGKHFQACILLMEGSSSRVNWSMIDYECAHPIVAVLSKTEQEENKVLLNSFSHPQILPLRTLRRKFSRLTLVYSNPVHFLRILKTLCWGK